MFAVNSKNLRKKDGKISEQLLNFETLFLVTVPTPFSVTRTHIHTHPHTQIK